VGPEFSGNTTGSHLVINPADQDQGSSCSSSSSTSAASAVSWTQANTGVYDINIYFANTSYPAATAGSFGANLNLYRGNVIAQFNESVNDPCDTKFSAAYIDGGSIGKYAAILQNVSLTAGNVYTVVFSGGNSQALGNWGMSIDPTIVRSNAASPGTWTQPDRTVDPPACTPDTGYSNQYFYAYTFVAQYPTYIFDTQNTDWTNTVDTYSFLYSGINNASVPSNCGGNGISLIYYGDTGDVKPLAFLGLNVGSYYTAVVSCWSSTSVKGSFGVYAMTGSQIGVVPTGTATSTTGTSDSSVIGISFLLLVIAALIASFST
jgi:hypothetical protein